MGSTRWAAAVAAVLRGLTQGGTWGLHRLRAQAPQQERSDSHALAAGSRPRPAAVERSAELRSGAVRPPQDTLDLSKAQEAAAESARRVTEGKLAIKVRMRAGTKKIPSSRVARQRGERRGPVCCPADITRSSTTPPEWAASIGMTIKIKF